MHICTKNPFTQKHPWRCCSMRRKIYCRFVTQTSHHQATTVIGWNNMAFTWSLEQPDYWKSDKMGFLWWRKWAPRLLFPWKLRCPTSPLKNTEMIQMNIQQRPTPTCSTETEKSLLSASCLLQTVGVAPLLNTGHSNDPNVTFHCKYTQEFDSPPLVCGNPFQTNAVRSPASPRASQKARSCPGHTEMWDVSSGKTPVPDRNTGLFWWKEDALTCQSCHSSVNNCLILCWKLIFPRFWGQRWPVSQPCSYNCNNFGWELKIFF